MLTRTTGNICLAALLCTAGATLAPAAESNPPTGLVIGFNNLIHTVADVDKSIAFYRDALGFQVNGNGPQKPAENPFVQKLTNTPGAKFRVATMKIPGAAFNLEFTEFTGIERNPGTSRMQDPGNSMFNLRVRDIDATLADMKKAGATVVTPGGAPLKRTNATTGASNRAIFLRDPDGYVIEMEQFYPEQPSDAPAGSKVLTASIGMSSSNAERTAEFWKNLGVDVKLGKAGPGNPTSMTLSATENAQFRGNAASIPGTMTRWTIFEFTGIDGKPFERRIQDPGAPAISLFVRDLGEAMKIVRETGIQVVSTGGVPSMRSATAGNVFIRDPDGFLVELIQR